MEANFEDPRLDFLPGQPDHFLFGLIHLDGALALVPESQLIHVTIDAHELRRIGGEVNREPNSVSVKLVC